MDHAPSDEPVPAAGQEPEDGYIFIEVAIKNKDESENKYQHTIYKLGPVTMSKGVADETLQEALFIALEGLDKAMKYNESVVDAKP